MHHRAIWGSVLFVLVMHLSVAPSFLWAGSQWEEWVVQHRDSLLPVITRQLQTAFTPASGSREEEALTPGPVKCATLPVFIYQQLQHSGFAGAADLSEMFDVQQTPAAFSFISPRGYFQLNYDVIGPNAVPTADTLPANGVPDYVEWAARYLDSAWVKEFEELGFKPPAINPPQSRYLVYFKDMNNYGYTAIQGGNQTYIVLENDFRGFPPNDDPDGDQLGALKVTIAHELKHASQYVISHWVEGNWVELDATHMEDVVFDEVNDYYNYLVASGSPLTTPTLPLDDGGGGSYEDCIWHHYLAERFGMGILLQFWQRRETHPSEAVLNTYQAVLQAFQSSLADAFAEFALWNFLTGQRAVKGVGYEEGVHYPTGQSLLQIPRFPVRPNVDQVNHLSALFYDAPIAVPDHFDLIVQMETDRALTLWTIFQPPDGPVAVRRMPVAAGAFQERWETDTPGEFLGMVVVNGDSQAQAHFQELVWTPPIIIQPKVFPDTKQDSGYYRLSATVDSYLAPIQEDGVNLYYRVNAMPWDSVGAVLDSATGEFQAEVPAQPYGTELAYYWQARDSVGTLTRFPYNAPDTLLQFRVLPDTLPPELDPVILIDPAISEVPIDFRTRIQDDLSAIDSAWIEIEGKGHYLLYNTGGYWYQFQWQPDSAAFTVGDSVRYRFGARDSEGNHVFTPWYRFFWTQWLRASRQPQKAIPDNEPRGVRDTISVLPEWVSFSDPIIVDMQVQVTANHSWVGDLVISLTAPDGHTIQLMNQVGDGDYGSRANGPEVTFADTASIGINEINFPDDSLVQGVFRPYPDRLQTFQRLNPVGDWVLTIEDRTPGDDGSLLQWGLAIKVRPYRGVLTGIVRSSNSPVTFKLYPNFPNPFNGETIIQFYLPSRQQVHLNIYNVLGEKVRSIIQNKTVPAGNYRIKWDGRSDSGLPLPTGVYFLVFQTPQFRRVQKMLLIR